MLFELCKNIITVESNHVKKHYFWKIRHTPNNIFKKFEKNIVHQ